MARLMEPPSPGAGVPLDAAPALYPAQPVSSAGESPSPGRVYLFLVLTTFFWGGSFLFSKIGLRDVGPLQFVFSRFALATLIMLLLFGRRLPAINRSIVRRGAIVGGALGLTNITFVFGVSGTSISRAGVLNNLFVLFIPLIGKLVWKERIGRVNLAGLALAAAGIWLLATSGGVGFNRGDLTSTVCALFIAIHIITVSRVLRDDDIYLVSLVQFATVTLLAGAALLATPTRLVPFTPSSLFSMVYCAIFPTVVCFTLQNSFQRHVTPTRAGLIYTLDPVWSLLAGFFILGERLLPLEWLGCALIFLAVLIPLLLRLLMENRLLRRYCRRP